MVGGGVMKFILSFCLFSSVILLADSVELLSKMELEKQKAINLYKAKHYEKSYKILSSLYLSVLTDVKVNFLLGRSAFETGRYEIALASFERVLILDERNLRAQLEIARTQFQLKMYEDARNGFEKVLNNPNIPKNVRTNVELFISKIDKLQQKSFFFANAKFGIAHDDNVNFGSLDSSYLLPDYGTFPTTAEKSNFAYDQELSAIHIYDIGQKNGYTIRNSLNLFNRDYDSMDNFDITFISYNPAITYQELKTTYEFNLMFDTMMLSDKKYLNIFSLMPTFIHKLDSETVINGNVKVSKKQFLLAADRVRDAINYSASLSYQKLWASSFMTFKLTYDTDKKDGGNRIDVDYKNYKFNFDYTKQILPGLTLRGDIEYRERKYSDYSTLFKSTRSDEAYRTGITVSKKIIPTVYLEGKAFYEKATSNQSVFSYDKTTFNLAISKSF